MFITPPPPKPTHGELLPIEGENMFERFMREQKLKEAHEWKDWHFYSKNPRNPRQQETGQ